MKQQISMPRVLAHKVLFTALIGVGCFSVSGAYYLFCRDGILLLLSGLVLLLCLIRAVGLYRIAAAGKYEVVEGICVGVSSMPFRRQLRVRIMDVDGVESALCLGKQAKIRIGFRYRFFFKEDQRPSLGSEYLDTALTTDHFLGFEELGKFSFNDDASSKNSAEAEES